MRKKPWFIFSFFLRDRWWPLYFYTPPFPLISRPNKQKPRRRKKVGFFFALLRILLYLLPPSARPPERYAPDITKVVAVQHNGAKSEYLLASLSPSFLFSFFPSPMEYTYLVKNADVAAALLPSPIHIPPFFLPEKKKGMEESELKLFACFFSFCLFACLACECRSTSMRCVEGNIKFR